MPTTLLDAIRGWIFQETSPFKIPATDGRSARCAQVHLAFGPLSVLPPRNEPGRSISPLPLWAVRVWEESTPTGEEHLERILLTSMPKTTLAQAWERVEWYKHRWVIEIVQSQITKMKLFRRWRGGDHIADLDLSIRHHNAVYQQLNELPLLFKGGFCQAKLHALAKCLNGLDLGSKRVVMSHMCFKLANLLSNSL